jgi:hypothetical protein
VIYLLIVTDNKIDTRRALSKRTAEETKKMYKDLEVPVLLYGSETRIMMKKDESRIESAEIKFLLSMKGCKRQD